MPARDPQAGTAGSKAPNIADSLPGSSARTAARAAPADASRVSVPAVVLFCALTVAALTWAKWWPYALKVPAVMGDHTLGTSALVDGTGRVPDPSLQAGLDYAVLYFDSVWIALVAGFLIAAAVETFLPRRWLLRTLRRRRAHGDVVTAGLASTASMMCSCCAAPVASSLRRQGASTPSTLAFWVGNPTLNPVVIVFLVVVLPWQWAAVRVTVGALLVFAVTAALARIARNRGEDSDPGEPAGALDCGSVGSSSLRHGAVRFVRVLGRLARQILPGYVAAVFVLGALRGWLFAASGSAEGAAVATAVVLALVGLLFPIATAAEIPIIQGLLAAGMAPAVAAVLLITLPAANLPSLLVMRREVAWRPLAVLAGAVLACGLLASVLIAALT
ncbi:MAG: permease [Actinomycetes bacterium]